jgi:ABC-2 type transport system ATP-binding protein
LPLVEELCHRVLVIAAGRAVALGTLEEIRAQMGAASHQTSLEDLFVSITTSHGEVAVGGR